MHYLHTILLNESLGVKESYGQAVGLRGCASSLLLEHGQSRAA